MGASDEFLAAIANVIAVSSLSFYCRYSLFSAIWLAATLAIGLAFFLVFSTSSLDKSAKAYASRFSIRYCVVFVAASLSLGLAAKYVDLVQLSLHLQLSIALASDIGSRQRKCILFAALAAVAVNATFPVPSSFSWWAETTVGLQTFLRLVGSVGALLYGTLLRRLNTDEFKAAEGLVSVGGLIVLGFVASTRFHPISRMVDSPFTPLALVVGGSVIPFFATQHRTITNASASVIPRFVVAALLVCAVSPYYFITFGAVPRTVVLVVRDCCLCGVSVVVGLNTRTPTDKRSGDDLGRSLTASSQSQNSFLRFICSGARERKLAMYLVLTVLIMFLEFGYGVVANSLGLVSDSFHMLLDAASLGIGLFSAYASSWVVSEKQYPFGYSRYETVGGFVNGTLLLFIAMYIMIESAERILDPPEIEADYLLTVSVIGLLVNVLGIIFFHEAHGHSHSHDHGHSHGGCSSSGVDHNMRGVYLHILADLLGSVSVIISSLLMRYFGWWIADPICSSISATLVLLSAFPLLEETGKVLLLSSPEYHDSLDDALRQIITQRDDVAEVLSVKSWVHSTAPREKIVCTVAAKLRNATEYMRIRDELHQQLSSALTEMIGNKNIHLSLHLE